MITHHAGEASPFQQASLREREQLVRLAYTIGAHAFYIQPSRSPYDFTIVKGETIDILEAKFRNCAHDKYPTTMIELEKYNRIKGLWKDKMCTRALYVEFFTDDIALIYNLATVEPKEWVRQKLVKNTAVDNGKIVKVVGFLEKEKAVKIKLIDMV